MKNLKIVTISVPDDHILKKINKTPTFNRLSRLQLKVGENIETVNHKQFADMIRLYPLIGVDITEHKG